MQNNNITSRRLNEETNTEESIPAGWFPETVEAEFATNEEATRALQRIKEVLKIIITVKGDRQDWPETAEWKDILPDWLLKSFRPEYSKEEIDILLKNKQPRIGWALEDWQFYFKNIMWEWWSGKTENNKLVLEILVDGHPFSLYELKCLIELIGAKSIKVID